MIIEAIVGLPEKLFYNTGIPASIIIINKSKAENLKNKVVFIDASSEYKNGKNQNTLTTENISKIVDSYDGLEDIDKFIRDNQDIICQSTQKSLYLLDVKPNYEVEEDSREDETGKFRT